MDSDVVERLFLQYYNDALLYTLTLCGNKSLAEDIVATAFYKALETADDKIASFKYWLLRVCRNLLYNHHRKEKRYVALPDNLQEQRDETLEKIIANEEYLALYRAIGLLPQLQREAITLFYYQNLKIEEIAKIINKTPLNTKVMLFRAREALKEILEAK